MTTGARETARAQRRNVVILCPTAWGLRNVVLSGMLDSLRARLPVTLLTSSLASNALAEHWDEAGQHELLCLPRGARARHDPLGVLMHASFARRHRISTWSIFDSWRRRDDGFARRLWSEFVRVAAHAGARDPLWRWQLGRLQRISRRRDDLGPIVTQLRALAPSLVVSTSCVVRDEAAYLDAAVRLGIPTLGCILSFDNLTSKGVLPVFDHYALWSARMREELLRLYPEGDPTHAHVTGTPQFDLHGVLRWGRHATLERLGLDPSDRYILYAANCATYTPSEPELVRALLARWGGHPVLGAHRLVVRPHPGDDRRRWLGLAADRRIVLSWPRDPDGRFASDAAQARLVSSVAHADACVNMASTMSLDAAVVDTPVVCVAFALETGSREDRLAGACYETTHYAPIAASGGVRLARSLDQLVDEIAAYAADPSRDRVERARLVADVCGPVDGAAAERIATLVARLAGCRESAAELEASRA